MTDHTLSPLPGSWSGLTWQQLCLCWQVKIRYGGNADIARSAALLGLLGLDVCGTDDNRATGERICLLRGEDGRLWTVTPRELSFMARKALPWFDYPYGDPGEEVVKDASGKVVREARDPVRGYVGPMRDALMLPQETCRVGWRTFALPQVACNNLTWHQYRSLQATAQQLFAGDADPGRTLSLQAQFLAHVLVPRSFALIDSAGGSMRIRPHYEYRYNAEQADGTEGWWERRLSSDGGETCALFQICFQAYQTAVAYYAGAYPLLFSGGGKTDPLRDALTGEVGTVNAVMKYAGYASQQEVYDSNLPFVLDILNTMTKEGKEIERINSRMKKK